MPRRDPNLTRVLEIQVAQRVRAQLAEYQPLLGRLRRFLRSPRVGAAEGAAGFAEGQRVLYRQGRGTFEAVVIRADGATLTLERLSDGKRLLRPAAKVSLISSNQAAASAGERATGPDAGHAVPGPSPAPAKPRRRRASRRIERPVGPIDLKPGQSVGYRLGSRMIEAEVVTIDRINGLVTLKRVRDGRTVVRPASRVGPMTAATPEAKAEPIKPIIRKRGEAPSAQPKKQGEEQGAAPRLDVETARRYLTGSSSKGSSGSSGAV